MSPPSIGSISNQTQQIPTLSAAALNPSLSTTPQQSATVSPTPPSALSNSLTHPTPMSAPISSLPFGPTMGFGNSVVSSNPTVPRPKPAFQSSAESLPQIDIDDEAESDIEAESQTIQELINIHMRQAGANSLSRASTGSQLDISGPVSPELPENRIRTRPSDPSSTPSHSSVPYHRLTALLDKRDWVQRPIPQGPALQCFITRRKEGSDKSNPSYDLFVEEPNGVLPTFILSACKRKTSRSSSSLYIISTAPFESTGENTIVGGVRSNFLGTAFTIFDNGVSPRKRDQGDLPLRKEFETKEPNILGFKGPRKMTVLLPGMTREGQRVEIQPANVQILTYDKETILVRNANKDPEIQALYNKQPQWNDDTQSFVLNFNGRVSMASVKNFQIVHDQDCE
ncbi:hypothetical protein HK096_007944 [Nowakowskiella sp. JEL0078]|nr:hypothetical protein HK096_007944 [Nowakowskiella sp. JEL0078]